jgi:23S rRNA (guanosine2251-2'-O)-methyltransferase
MSSPKVLFGFHAVGCASRPRPQSIIEIYYEPTRRDQRMRQFLERAREAGVRLIEADGLRLAKLAGSHGHQGVAARVKAMAQASSLDDLLDGSKPTAGRCCWCSTASPTRTTWAPACAWPTAPARMP